MSVQSERITILGTPDFKAFLVSEAQKEGVSVSQLVRKSCSGSKAGQDEQLLIALTAELKKVTAQATKSLEKGLSEAESVLAELRCKRECC